MITKQDFTGVKRDTIGKEWIPTRPEDVGTRRLVNKDGDVSRRVDSRNLSRETPVWVKKS